MPKCDTCGTNNPEGSGYCGVCGGVITVAKPAAKAGVHRLRLLPAGGGDSRAIELRAGKYLCGRSPPCQILLDDPFISPRHLQLTAEASLRLEDLGSTNGTFLRLKSQAPLEVGDELRMGLQCLRLEAMAPPAGASGGGRIWGTPSQGARFRLMQLLEGGGAGEALPLPDGEHLIGRDEGQMTFPGDLAMSGRHALIIVQGERAFVRDLDSSNGTFLRLRESFDLRVGDRLLLGNQQIRYESA
jgi:pSer/pThr/pTyr-binding forkhead associated (FHA) protein